MMFRALLWKEWRRLWMLPVVVALLAAISFYLAQSRGQTLEPGIWMVTFGIWLFAGAFIISMKLYAPRKYPDLFLPSMPLDRFRLWWLLFFTGITVLVATGLVLYVVTTLLTHSYPKSGLYESLWRNRLWTCISVSMLIYGVTASFSFPTPGLPEFPWRNRLWTCMNVSMLICSVMMMFLIEHSSFRSIVLSSRAAILLLFGPADVLWRIFSDSPVSLGVRFLVPVPALLFLSLALFTGEDLWRRTRRTILLGYTFSAVVTLLPTAIGIAYLHSRANASSVSIMAPTKVSEIEVHEIFPDGNRILLEINPAFLLVSVDMARQKIYRIGKGYSVYMNAKKDVFAYRRFAPFPVPYSSELVLSDFRGTHRTPLLKESFGSYISPPIWSNDGRLLGITCHDSCGQGGESFVAIYDGSGSLKGKHEILLLGKKDFIHAIGWDSESRFYFSKHVYKGKAKLVTHWRVRADDLTPEHVLFLPQDIHQRKSLSPDGGWIVNRKELDESSVDELWLYDIVQKKDHLVSTNLHDYEWSSNGKMVAYIEEAGTKEDEIRNESPFHRLVLYEPATGEKASISMEGAPRVFRIYSWSPSSDHILLGARPDPYALSVKTKEIRRIPSPEGLWHSVQWMADDRLIWAVRNKLITTDPDGSNPEEIFRIENSKYYLYGKEQN